MVCVWGEGERTWCVWGREDIVEGGHGVCGGRGHGVGGEDMVWGEDMGEGGHGGGRTWGREDMGEGGHGGGRTWGREDMGEGGHGGGRTWGREDMGEGGHGGGRTWGREDMYVVGGDGGHRVYGEGGGGGRTWCVGERTWYVAVLVEPQLKHTHSYWIKWFVLPTEP